MTRTHRLLIGGLTAWPYVYIPQFILIVGAMGVIPSLGLDMQWALAVFPVVMLLHFGTILAILGLTVFYIVHIFRNETYTTEQKLLWALVLVLGGILVMPVYYWMHLRPGASGSL